MHSSACLQLGPWANSFWLLSCCMFRVAAALQGGFGDAGGRERADPLLDLLAPAGQPHPFTSASTPAPDQQAQQEEGDEAHGEGCVPEEGAGRGRGRAC